MAPQPSSAHISLRAQFLILVSNKKTPGSLEKWPILMLGQEIHKMSLEHLFTAKKEGSAQKPKDGAMSPGHR